MLKKLRLCVNAFVKLYSFSFAPFVDSFIFSFQNSNAKRTFPPYIECTGFWEPVILEKEIAMDTVTIPDSKGVTLEDVWMGFRELTRKQEEYARQHELRMAENARKQEEYNQWKEESDRKWDKRMARLDKSMGDLSNRFGEMAEHLVKPGIYNRFNELGYHFDARSPGGLIIDGEDGKTKAEIDLLLENGDTIMAVEIKVTPKVKHIAEHIRRLEILRDHRRKRNDLRQVEGAIAGAVFGTDEKKATIDAGLYVIEQSGDTMKIEVPDGFVPTRW